MMPRLAWPGLARPGKERNAARRPFLPPAQARGPESSLPGPRGGGWRRRRHPRRPRPQLVAHHHACRQTGDTAGCSRAKGRGGPSEQGGSVAPASTCPATMLQSPWPGMAPPALSRSALPQRPAVADAPLLLKFQVTAPPRCTIKPSGTSVAVSATLDIFLAPLEEPPVQLSSMTVESRLSAKVALQKKALQMQLDLRRFRIYSNQSVLESLALIPLQTPLKTLLQLTIMPLINERTKKGVQIPLPEGMDFLKEVVTNHMGYLTIGADLHFSKGLREVIEKYRTGPAPWPTSVAA